MKNKQPQRFGMLSSISKVKQTPGRKVVAANNSIFAHGNALPHALTFERYEDNVRNDSYNKVSRKLFSGEEEETNHHFPCSYCMSKPTGIGTLENMTGNGVKEINEYSSIDMAARGISSISINSPRNVKPETKIPEVSVESDNSESNESIEYLVNHYTSRYRGIWNKSEETEYQVEKKCPTDLMETSLFNDDFFPEDINSSFSATSTPKNFAKTFTGAFCPDEFEEYSVEDLSRALLNDNETCPTSTNATNKVRILVGVFGRCKIIDCNLNDESIPYPEYNKYGSNGLRNIKAQSKAQLNMNSSCVSSITSSGPIAG